jgi:hypothetical protein
MRQMDQGKGGAHMGGGWGARGRAGRTGPDRPGWARSLRGSKPTTRTTTNRNSDREPKSETGRD